MRDTPILSSAAQALIISQLERKGLSLASITDPEIDDEEEIEDILHGMEEVNLLGNLNDGSMIIGCYALA